MAIDTTNGAPLSSSLTAQQELEQPVTFNYDKVFENLVDKIVPATIATQNKEVIETFVSALAELSPISVNIIDVFNKGVGEDEEHNHIEGVQEGFAQMYLENFWSVVENAKDNYTLQNRLNNILKKYESLSEGSAGLDVNISFFQNINELYTEQRYVLGKDFKEKKGTATALEYAYKLGWLAQIEGPLRDSYFFDIDTPECTGGIPTGMIIACEDPYVGGTPDENGVVYPSHPTCTGLPQNFERFVNEFYIGDKIDGEDCRPFSYNIEGSMIPAMFEAFVIPLAHPVGFSYSYVKLLKYDAEDFFNLEYIYKADGVSVKSLCPSGDCANASTDVYSNTTVAGITNSTLKYFESGDVYVGDFQGWVYDKYTFENGSYLISYKEISNNTNVKEVIHYFDIADINNATNVVRNGNFDADDLYWDLGTGWSVVNGIAVNTGGSLTDVLSQDITLKEGSSYNVRVTSTLDTALDSFIVNVGGVLVNILSSGTTNTTVVIGVAHTTTVTVYGDNKNFSVDDIEIVEVKPTKVYEDYTHSSIIVTNPASPLAVLYTHDIMSREQDFNIGEMTTIPIFDADRTNQACKNVVVNPRFTVDGSTIIKNGEFNDPIGTYWTAVGDWSQSITSTDSYMTLTNGDSADTLTQAVAWESKEYELVGRLKNASYEDYLVITIGGVEYETNTYGQFIIAHTGNITDTDVVLSGKNDISGTANFELESFDIRELDDVGLYAWTADANWAVVNGKATHTLGLATEKLTQSIPLESGKEVRINFDGVVENSQARAIFKIGSDIHKFGGAGIKRYSYTPSFTGNHQIEFYGSTDSVTFSIDNVEVDCDKDIIADEMTSLYTNRLAIIGFDLYIAQAQLDVESNITQGGGFIIGGIILPHGDVSTQYMYDELSIASTGQVTALAIDDIDFRVPANWSTDTGWDVVDGANPTLNYAICDGTQLGFSKIRQQFIIADAPPPNTRFVRVDFEMDVTSLNGYIRVFSGITDGTLGVDDEIKFYGSGAKSFIMLYDHSLDVGVMNEVSFEASHLVLGIQEEFIGRINSVELTYIV